MSRIAIRKALEQHLETLNDLPTEFENVAFQVPTDDTPWQRANIVFSDTVALGVPMGAPEQWIGTFMIALFFPRNQGPRAAEARAVQIRGDKAAGVTGLFYRGLILHDPDNTVSVRILQPTDSPPLTDPKWWGFTIRVPFFCVP